MGAEQTPDRPQRRARPDGTALRKIPLPALPHFRMPAAAARTSTPEAAPEASPVSSQDVSDALFPERTGDSGAVVLNDLVDQIAREIESHHRHDAPEGVLPAYRDVLACTHEQARVRR